MNKGTHTNLTQVFFSFLFFLFGNLALWAQSPAKEWTPLSLKSNLLYDATASINVGVEYPLSSRWSLDVSGNYNPFTFADNKKWKHWLIQPEARFWFQGVFQKHFLALHVLGGEYNIGNAYLPYGIFKGTHTNRYEGWALGVGMGYGYRQRLGGRWSLEAEVGVGYAHSRFDRYECRVCGSQTGKGKRDYLGPTKAAITLVYTLPVRVRKCVSQTITLRDTIVRHDTVFIPVPLPLPVDSTRKVDTLRQWIDTTRIDSASFYLTLRYKAGSSLVRRDLGDNAAQLSKLSAFIDRQLSDTTLRVRAIRIIGYCSVEGLATTNDRIARERAGTVADYIRGLYPQVNGRLYSTGVGEDWDGLRMLIEQCVDSFQGREDALRVIREVPILKGRESQLMRLHGGDTYRWMRQYLFPRLRRVECRVEYVRKE